MRILKALGLVVIIIALIGGACFFYRHRLLTGLANLLIVDHPPQQAEIIYLLNGGATSTRPFHAAELFKQGVANQVVIADAEITPVVELGLYPHTTDVVTRVMEEMGVPADHITIIDVDGGATSTRDEAEVLRRYAELNGINKIVIVTSAFHTRRTHWIFDRTFSDSAIEIKISAAPETRFDATNWWKSERGFLTFFNESLKLVYYVSNY